MKKLFLFFVGALLISGFENCSRFETAGAIGLPSTDDNGGQFKTAPKAQISWSANSASTQDEFVIEMSTDGTNFQQVQVVDGKQTSTTVAGLKSGTKYYFRIKAINQVSDSLYSEMVVASIP